MSFMQAAKQNKIKIRVKISPDVALRKREDCIKLDISNLRSCVLFP